MPAGNPTERELAVQNYAEETRRHELLDDAIRTMQNYAWLLVASEKRRVLYAIAAEMKDAHFEVVRQAFKQAVETQ